MISRRPGRRTLPPIPTAALAAGLRVRHPDLDAHGAITGRRHSPNGLLRACPKGLLALYVTRFRLAVRGRSGRSPTACGAYLCELSRASERSSVSMKIAEDSSPGCLRLCRLPPGRRQWRYDIEDSPPQVSELDRAVCLVMGHELPDRLRAYLWEPLSRRSWPGLTESGSGGGALAGTIGIGADNVNTAGTSSGPDSLNSSSRIVSQTRFSEASTSHASR